MIDPSIIDAKILNARELEQQSNAHLLAMCGYLVAMKPNTENVRQLTLDALTSTIGPTRHYDPNWSSAYAGVLAVVEQGSYANSLFSAITIMIDRQVRLRLLEFIASPDFYSGLMRSAAEIPE